MAGQDGVAIELFLHLHGRMEVKRHLQASGDLVGLIHAIGAHAAHIQLLQSHDVRLQGGDDVGDAGHIQATVGSDATMDIVGEDAGHRAGVLRV